MHVVVVMMVVMGKVQHILQTVWCLRSRPVMASSECSDAWLLSSSDELETSAQHFILKILKIN